MRERRNGELQGHSLLALHLAENELWRQENPRSVTALQGHVMKLKQCPPVAELQHYPDSQPGRKVSCVTRGAQPGPPQRSKPCKRGPGSERRDIWDCTGRLLKTLTK